MWIKNTDPKTHPTRVLRDENGTLGERVEFTSNWKANVSEDVAKAMLDEYDHIVPVEKHEDEPQTDE